MQWFYEFDGEKVGPVPAKTIRHLARHGAIRPETQLWTDDSSDPVFANRIRDLFPTPPAAHQGLKLVADLMCTALNACRDGTEDKLEDHQPPISACFPFADTHVLLEYSVSEVEPITVSDSLRRKSHKEIRQLYQVVVEAELCYRTSHRTKLDHLKNSKVGRKNEPLRYLAREFADGSWMFDLD